MPWKWSTAWLLVLASCVGAPPATPLVPPHADPAVLAQEDAVRETEHQRLLKQGWSPRDLVDLTPVSVPDFDAVVVRVQNRRVVLRITANPERRAMRRGLMFMLFNDKTYLGEAVVEEVLPDFTVQCRLDLVKGKVLPGDLARTYIPH